MEKLFAEEWARALGHRTEVMGFDGLPSATWYAISVYDKSIF
jgi:hypothetical protein